MRIKSSPQRMAFRLHLVVVRTVGLVVVMTPNAGALSPLLPHTTTTTWPGDAKAGYSPGHQAAVNPGPGSRARMTLIWRASPVGQTDPLSIVGLAGIRSYRRRLPRLLFCDNTTTSLSVQP
jgi:hypothetical protein